MSTATLPDLDRRQLLDWYRRNRLRSVALFDLLADEAYYSQPIALRHPIVFYEGHLPGFSFNTLVKRGLGCPSIDARLETLFARGIDPHESQATADTSLEATRKRWPSRQEVRRFADEADRQVIEALATGDIAQPGHPLLDHAEAAYSILEHEAMHQETLLYMWHRLPLEWKRQPEGYQALVAGARPAQEWIDLPAGRATLGVDRGDVPFAWDNERPACAQDVAGFSLQKHKVTNGDYLEFIEAGGYGDRRWWQPEDWAWLQAEGLTHPLFWEPADRGGWTWRGMFERFPLPLSWPVYVSHAEASAYAAWRGFRLPTEAEFQRAAYGDPAGGERPFPWGSEPPTPARGVFDFVSWDPQPVGSHPDGASAWGVHDLVGNGWEWTRSVFGPFPGFAAIPSYPEYSADFFDGQHFVIKGASPATARELVRPSFRNWFRARYPYVYAGFRCVRQS